MTAPEKVPPATEVSLKYMAWNIKEISCYLKDIAMQLTCLSQSVDKLLQFKTCPKPTQPVTKVNESHDEIPF